jgi:hypothetical protein
MLISTFNMIFTACPIVCYAVVEQARAHFGGAAPLPGTAPPRASAHSPCKRRHTGAVGLGADKP